MDALITGFVELIVAAVRLLFAFFELMFAGLSALADVFHVAKSDRSDDEVADAD